VWRIPLPLPSDGLRAVNVYALETSDGLTLIDGGWAIPEARSVLKRSLRGIGYGLRDIREFLVTHVHRDHYTMSRLLGDEFGAVNALGAQEQPALDLLASGADAIRAAHDAAMVVAGAQSLMEELAVTDQHETNLSLWRHPDRWLETDQQIEVGDRELSALHTPGHTPGHYVFADLPVGMLFAGDHVLPTITPSIGFTFPMPTSPLADFMTSLAKVRALPDLTLLPAHGPLAPSTHARVDELLAFHEERLDACLAALEDETLSSFEVAQRLTWTRRHKHFDQLDVWNQRLASFETKAHLDVLVARGTAARRIVEGTARFRQSPRAAPASI
jgi:glyoxylase-like metal-dependent hydrolase (beta-lactamase superfamily II)